MLRLTLTSLASLLLGATDPDLPVPTKFDIDFYATYTSEYETPRDEPLAQWEARLRAALKKMSPARAAATLAPDFGLTDAQAQELVHLWLFVETDSDNKGRQPELHQTVRRRYLALVSATHRAPLVLAAAAIGLAHVGTCQPGDFDTLLAGAADPAQEGWLIARSGNCAGWYRKFLEVAPDRAAAALIRLVDIAYSSPEAELPIRGWLTGKAALARVADADRRAVEARMDRDYLSLLIDAGLDARARAFGDSLDPAILEQVLRDGFPVLRAQADGLGFTLSSTRADGQLRLHYAGALALDGRFSEADAMLARVPGIDAARTSFDCLWKAPITAQPRYNRCPGNDNLYGSDIVILDHFLHHRGEDAYPIAEVFFSSMGGGGSGDGVSVKLRCKVMDEPEKPGSCDDMRGNRTLFQSYSNDPAEIAAEAAALHAARLPGQAEAEAGFVAEFGPADVPTIAERAASFSDRPPVEPETPAFAKRPIPTAYLGSGAAAPWLKGFAPLPKGFAPVRIGRDGNRVAVISVSQNYDPVGELSAGGYWVHLSADGGKSWHTPLYTGLAENFPYVVLPNSALPLFDGDTLDIAVEVALLDTSSIGYPPVGMRTRRREKNIYLRVPIADLTRDRDGDGLTDLAAHHLLLDEPGRPGATPFLVGSDAAHCKGPASPERQAMIAILGKLFEADTRAIIEPIDRPADAPMLGGWRGAANSADRPVFITGSPADYACLTSNKMMIVYDKTDITRIERFTPDFHAVSIGEVTYNRERTRGFVQYSMGWAGGTMRLIMIDGKWQFDEIGSWVT